MDVVKNCDSSFFPAGCICAVDQCNSLWLNPLKFLWWITPFIHEFYAKIIVFSSVVCSVRLIQGLAIRSLMSWPTNFRLALVQNQLGKFIVIFNLAIYYVECFCDAVLLVCQLTGELSWIFIVVHQSAVLGAYSLKRYEWCFPVASVMNVCRCHVCYCQMSNVCLRGRTGSRHCSIVVWLKCWMTLDEKKDSFRLFLLTV